MRPSSRSLVLLCLMCPVAGTHAAENRYVIDAVASDVHWLVYKSGALARRGHNHVIAARGIDGEVAVNPQSLASSTFEIVIPVAQIEIDNPALRSVLGPDFASVPTAGDIAGTQANMLSERVLQGETFPTIRLTGYGPMSTSSGQALSLKVELLGRTIDLTVPTAVSVSPELVEASGEFDLNHADLGMQPFSVMMGALQVGEKIAFSYHIIARPLH